MSVLFGVQVRIERRGAYVRRLERVLRLVRLIPRLRPVLPYLEVLRYTLHHRCLEVNPTFRDL